MIIINKLKTNGLLFVMDGKKRVAKLYRHILPTSIPLTDSKGKVIPRVHYFLSVPGTGAPTAYTSTVDAIKALYAKTGIVPGTVEQRIYVTGKAYDSYNLPAV
jgi:hypothetical protein